MGRAPRGHRGGHATSVDGIHERTERALGQVYGGGAINLILELAVLLQFVHLVGERERLIDPFLRRLSFDDRP
jgi:hypothetical protein